MKNKKKITIASLALAVWILLSSPTFISKKNDYLFSKKTIINIEDISYQPENMTLEYKKDDDVVVKPLKLIINDSEGSKGNKQEKYQFGYIINDTAIYNTILDKEEKIEAYQKVLIINEEEKITLVKYINDDNKLVTGYVLNDVLNKLPDTFIEVDISEQTIKMYIDGELIINSLVVTGMSYESPTPVGYFDIDEKKSPTFLKGYDDAGNVTYSRFVDYWMPFEGGIGLHDAEYHSDPEWGTYHGWRTPEDFGGDTYTYNGSHGCVNLLNEVAKEIYENSEVGTKVLVHK